MPGERIDGACRPGKAPQVGGCRMAGILGRSREGGKRVNVEMCSVEGGLGLIRREWVLNRRAVQLASCVRPVHLLGMESVGVCYCKHCLLGSNL